MGRFILLTVAGFIALTFLSVALKGALRRMMRSQIQQKEQARAPKNPLQANRVLYRKDDITVLEGETSKGAIAVNKRT